MTRSRGVGQVHGETHPAAKASAMDIALARLIAADAKLDKGWQIDMARAIGMTDNALSIAITGHSWAWMTNPPPVPAYKHHHYKHNRSHLRKCPRCNGRKTRPTGGPCSHIFHTIDHRKFTSPLNAKKAHAANRKRRP